MDILARKKPTITPIIIEKKITVKIISKTNPSLVYPTIIIQLIKKPHIIINKPKAIQNNVPLG